MNMSSKLRSGQRKSIFEIEKKKALINKAKLSEQVDQALEHDGENWSLLAYIKEQDMVFVDAMAKFGDMVREWTEENGYESNSYKNHATFTKDGVMHYISPIGHADPTFKSGFNLWDFHINTATKDAFINYLKQLEDA